MKNKFFVALLTLSSLNLHAQVKKNLFRLLVQSTQYNEEKPIIHQTDVKKRILSLVLIEDKYLVFVNEIQGGKNLIYGDTNNFVEEVDSSYAEYKFIWNFENTLTNESGRAKVAVSLAPTNSGMLIFRCIVLLQDKTYITYSGYCEDDEEDFGLN